MCHHHNNVSKRPRVSPYTMITVEKALSSILEHTTSLPITIKQPIKALGSVLGDTVYAARPHPPFPASVKDGYAVVSTDQPGNRRVLPSSTAGKIVSYVQLIIVGFY